MKKIMKSLKESILNDMEDTLSIEPGKDLPKVIELLKDPLSAHYHSYSIHEIEHGVKREANTFYFISPEDKQKWCGKYKTPTQLWEDKGQPGWEVLHKLAKTNLRKVKTKDVNSKETDYADVIIFEKPSKNNYTWHAKIMNIYIFRKNAKLRDRYINLSFPCDDSLSYVGYSSKISNSWPAWSSSWDIEIYDLNSNAGWVGLLEEIVKQLPHTGWGDAITDKTLQKYPFKCLPIK
jgi:hypothetical protein